MCQISVLQNQDKIKQSWDRTVMEQKKSAAVRLSLLEQLEDGQDDVVDVAETRGLRLLGVVESTSPVDGDICLLLVQLHCSGWGKNKPTVAAFLSSLDSAA